MTSIIVVLVVFFVAAACKLPFAAVCALAACAGFGWWLLSKVLGDGP